MVILDQRGVCRGCDIERRLFGPPDELRTVSHRGRSPVDARLVLGTRCSGSHRPPKVGTVRRVSLPTGPRRQSGPTGRTWVAAASGVEPRGSRSEPAAGVQAVLTVRLVSDGDTPPSEVGRRIEVPLTGDMLRAIAMTAQESGAVFHVDVADPAALLLAEVRAERRSL